ncbi:MAG: HEAT repeat domain-containing protein, partial [Gammaproteobacteria bacterium]
PILQDRVLALSGTVLSPILGGASGLALLGMIHLFGASATGIAAVTALMLVLVIAIAIRAARAYGENLREMVESRAISGIALSFEDPSAARTLRGMLGAGEPGSAVFALELLGRNPVAGFADTVMVALGHPDAAVRRAAALAAARIPETPAADALCARLEAEADPGVRAALLDTLARSSAGPRAIGLFAHFLADPDEDVRLAAASGSASLGGERGRESALALLAEAASSREATQRAWSARLIGAIGDPALSQPLLPLLADEAQAVREAAIASAARLPGNDCAAAVAANLRIPGLRSAIAAAMRDAKPELLEALDALCGASDTDEDLREAVLHLLGSLGTAEAARLLEHRLADSPAPVQDAVLSALAAAHYRPGDSGRRLLSALLERHATRARWLLRARFALGALDGAGRLGAALDRELRAEQEMLFATLGLLHPGDGVDRIRHACLDAGSEDQQAAGIELLEGLLRRIGSESLLPIFEGGAAERRIAALGPAPEGSPRDPAGFLAALLADDRAHARRWLAAVVLDFLNRTPGLDGAVTVPQDPVIAAALAWTR